MDNPTERIWQGIEQSLIAGRLAHAWLLQGRPDGDAIRFAERMLDLIFDHHPQVIRRAHPDIVWIEPHSKSRQIGIDPIRDLIAQLSKSTYSGGWKAGVLLFADRMTQQASNALLKTLEEPTERTVLLLLTDQPQALLPTVVSRCQRIRIGEESAVEAAVWKDELFHALSQWPPDDPIDASLQAGRISGLIERLKKEIETEESRDIPEDLTAKEKKTLLDARTASRWIEQRTAILNMLLLWQRDILLCLPGFPGGPLHFPEHEQILRSQAQRCTRSDALQRISFIEQAARRMERNLPVEPVLQRLFSDMVRKNAQ